MNPARATRPRKPTTAMEDVLARKKQLRALNGHPRKARQRVAEVLQIEYVDAQSVIFYEGAVADKLYLLVDGSVNIERLNHATGEIEIVHTYNTKTSERRYFGERALWADEPRAATARAIEPTNLLVVRAGLFAEFLTILPELIDMFGVNKEAFDRINDLSEVTASLVRDIAAARPHLLQEPQPIEPADESEESFR